MDRVSRALRRAARQAAHTSMGRRLRQKTARPTVSVIVPFYGVEAYIRECLESVAGQSFGDLEVVLIDDESPDGSRAIAEEFVERDYRFRLITRANGGLGAARNTGVREARGQYLTFLDSDDTLPNNALEVLVGSAEASGSDIVAGAMERFDTTETWLPTWVPDVHDKTRQGIRINDFLPAIRNLYACDKLWRTDFWREQGLWFREGVSYEDQPLVTQLYARAKTVDVVSDITYSYRQREARDSISQQTASIKDLRDRIEAWRLSRDVLLDEAGDEVYHGWLQTLFDAHFQWYVTSPGTADDAYWNELVEVVRDFTKDAPDELWARTLPGSRVAVWLTAEDRRDDLHEFLARGGKKPKPWASSVRPDGVFLELPFHDDPSVPDHLFLIHPDKLSMEHAVERVWWTEGDTDAAATVRIEGWAYIQKIDPSVHEQRVSVALTNERTGARVEQAATGTGDPAMPPPFEDPFNDYSAGSFTVDVPLQAVLSPSDPDEATDGDEWAVSLIVDVAGFRAERRVTKLIRAGSAGVIPARGLADGRRLVCEWRLNETMRISADARGVATSSVALEGRTISGAIEPGTDVARVEVSGPDGQVAHARVRGGLFRVTLPSIPPPEPGERVVWHVNGRAADDDHRGLVPQRRKLDSSSTGNSELFLDVGRNGELKVAEVTASAVANRVRVDDDGRLWVSGRLIENVGAARVAVEARHLTTWTRGDEVSLEDGQFAAPVLLEHQVYRFGPRPLPTGGHSLRLVITAGDRELRVPLLVGDQINDELPYNVETSHHEGRVVRGPDGGVQVNLRRPLGDARGPYQQRLLQESPPTTDALVPGVLFRSYFGETATDNGVSIQRALAERGSDLPVYWAVQDHSVIVPDGATPVIVGSREWYRLLHNIEYYVDNMFQPEYCTKRPGQTFVQTFHGYPFKQMGHPHWKNLGLAQARIDTYQRRANEWNYLVSPARYATSLLARDFGYDGDVLEIGYPRNDVLNLPHASEIRDAVRESLGIREDQTAVLYAPTFRDYMAEQDSTAPMPDFLDFDAAMDALGDDFVLLVRGHAFNARTEQRIGHRAGVIDVTDYPEVSDLYLAADAAVVDYSSLRFDFGVTGKPMIFQVPDLQIYQDNRGWLFDFEPTAPGPFVDTTDDVVAALRDLDGVRSRYAEAYETFRSDYLDLEDGHAADRFIDAVFG